jgi:hypothetical protein
VIETCVIEIQQIRCFGVDLVEHPSGGGWVYRPSARSLDSTAKGISVQVEDVLG